MTRRHSMTGQFSTAVVSGMRVSMALPGGVVVEGSVEYDDNGSPLFAPDNVEAFMAECERLNGNTHRLAEDTEQCKASQDAR